MSQPVKGFLEIKEGYELKELREYVDVLHTRLIQLESDVDELRTIHKEELKEHRKIDWEQTGYTDKQILKLMPNKKLRDKFYNWMRGQTVGVDYCNQTRYYKWDVDKFLGLEKTGRKEHPLEWD